MSYLKDVFDRFKREASTQTWKEGTWSFRTVEGRAFGFDPQRVAGANDVRESRLYFPSRKLFRDLELENSKVEYVFFGEPASEVEAFAEELRSELNALLGRQSDTPLATFKRIVHQIEERRLSSKAFSVIGEHRYELTTMVPGGVTASQIRLTLERALETSAPVYILYKASHREEEPYPTRTRRVNVVKIGLNSFQGKTANGYRNFTLDRVSFAVVEGNEPNEVGYELKLTVELKPGRNAKSVITVSKYGVPSLLEQQLSEEL